MSAPELTRPVRPRHTDRGILLVCLAVFGLMAGQQMVNPALPPLARELGLSEVALGLVWTVGASGVVLTSPFWAGLTVAWGYRTVLLVSLPAAVLGLGSFALVARIGLAGLLPVGWLFAGVLLTRGVVFGLAWAATPATALSYVARETTGARERVRGMSMIGAAQGLGLAAGPALGGVLSLGGLLAPVIAAPVIVAVVSTVVLILLPKRERAPEPAPSVRVSPRDARLWPFLTIGFTLYLAITLVLMTVGFLVQDRLQLGAAETGRVTGMVMVAGAGMIIVVQTLVVPRLQWSPARLIRVGATVMTAGMVLVTAAGTAPLIAAGVGVLGAGLGFALPGFMSAPTLLADRSEQGSVAGLLGSASALAFMIGPLVGTALYSLAPVATYLAGTGVLVAVTAFAWVHPSVARTEQP